MQEKVPSLPAQWLKTIEVCSLLIESPKPWAPDQESWGGAKVMHWVMGPELFPFYGSYPWAWDFRP